MGRRYINQNVNFNFKCLLLSILNAPPGVCYSTKDKTRRWIKLTHGMPVNLPGAENMPPNISRIHLSRGPPSMRYLPSLECGGWEPHPP